MVPTGGRPFRASLLMGLAHALLFGLAFPPFSFWGCGIAAVVVAGMEAWRTGSPRRSGLAFALASLPVWGFHHAWLWNVTMPGTPALAAYLSVWTGLFVWLAATIRRGWPSGKPWVLIPVVWTGLEVLRGEVLFNGYPWFLIAHPTASVAPLASLGSVIGDYGVGTLLAAFAGLLVHMQSFRAAATDEDERYERRARFIMRIATPAVLLLVALSVLAMLRSARQGSAPTVRVAAVQTNLPQDNKLAWSFEDRLRDFESWLALTEQAAGAGEDGRRPDLIVWPETMFPGATLSSRAVQVERESGLGFRGTGFRVSDFADGLLTVQERLGVPMVVGALGMEGLRIEQDDRGIRYEADARFNSVFVLDGGEVTDQRYDKLHLTPFGEVMPGISRWPWLEKKLLAIGAQGMSFDLDAGAGPVALVAPLGALDGVERPGEVRIATPICFEATSSGVCRKLVFDGPRRRADILINVTNDGWFGGFDAVREHHLLIARWRCIELGTPMVRAANTGISCLIGADGKVIRRWVNGRSEPAWLAPRTEGVLTVDVPLPGEKLTAFARIGHHWGWVCMVGMLASLGSSLLKVGGRRADQVS